LPIWREGREGREGREDFVVDPEIGRQFETVAPVEATYLPAEFARFRADL